MRVVLAAFVLLFSGVSQAVYRFNFDIFTSNGPYCNDERVNTYMEVSNGVPSIVDFTFYNISTIESSVAKIYFDDGVLLNIATITNGPGTDFSAGASGNNLPGGETIGFYADREFTIGADPPPSHNGVNPANPPEWVKIRFNLDPADSDLEDVIAELYSGELRVGIHIISISGLTGGSYSESAIAIIPEPATLSLLAFGAAALLRRRKS
jgi:hypothetical protein